MTNAKITMISQDANQEIASDSQTIHDRSMDLGMHLFYLREKFERLTPGDGARIHLLYEMNALDLKLALLEEISIFTGESLSD